MRPREFFADGELAKSAGGSAQKIPLVSVIVPAYNAERTITATLASVCGQTYSNMEIIVVDDGSTDSTALLVEVMAGLDARIRLFRQHNLGVASARNLAIQHSRGELIAPIDADDLWSPVKLEKQVERLLSEPSTCVLVYNWSYHIDCEGAVMGRTRISHGPGQEKEVLCKYNMVGNGSTPLMKKSAVLKCGGYDATMRELNYQGCEDYKLYLDLSCHGIFSVIDEYMTGYRIHSDNMSSDLSRMIESRRLSFRGFLSEFPGYRKRVCVGEAEWLLHKMLTDILNRDYSRIINIWKKLRELKWICILGAILPILMKCISRKIGGDKLPKNSSFYDID